MTGYIAVLGAGESGTGAAVLAASKGYDVFVSDYGNIDVKYKKVLDSYGIEYEERQHSFGKLERAEEIIKSPGIPDDVDVVKRLSFKGIPVISDIEFASRYTKGKKICITGSNGKTTTTLLTYHILKNGGIDAGLGGNVGKSFAMQLKEKDHAVWVLEISSFQLDGMYDFKADIAVLTNITPDHLDRYNNDFNNYIASKFRIIRNQTASDHFIWSADDKVVKENLLKYSVKAQKHPFSCFEKNIKDGGFVENNNIIININNKQFTMTLESLALQGRHNIYNSLAAGIVGRIFDLRKESIKESLSDFQNVEHRLEFVSKVHGIEFINDSKATNVNSTWYALESMNRPVIWIAGGVDKGNDYSILKELVRQKVKAIICLGVDNSKIIKAFSKDVPLVFKATSANEAVNIAYNIGEIDDIVLLSPACASFDLFSNYEERGRLFKQAVYDL